MFQICLTLKCLCPKLVSKRGDKMPTFNVIFTGDTMYDQSDMGSYAKGAGGVVFEDVNRAVTNYRQGGGLEVLLVQGSWGVGRKPSRKTLDAMKYGSEVTIVSDEIFMARDGIKDSKRRLDEEAAVNAPSTPRPRPAALALALVTLTPCSRAVPTPCPVPPRAAEGRQKGGPLEEAQGAQGA